MTQVSSAPTAYTNLIALLRASTDFAGVQISEAYPHAGLAQEDIYFADDFELDEQAAALGRQRRNETYVIKLVISIAVDGDDPAACRNRFFQLLAGVENVLRPPAGPAGDISATLNGAVNEWTGIERVVMRSGPNGGQRVAVGDVSIRCSHRK